MLINPHHRRRKLNCSSGRLGRSGTAVIEFALVAPLLVSLLLSVADLAPSLMVKFKLGTATQAVADLAAQAATMQAADVANFFAIGGDVMAPFSGTPLIQRVSNIASDGKGSAFVYWSCSQSGLAPLAARSTVASPPSGLISTSSNGTNTSYIMVESQYSYTAPAGFILKAAQLMNVVAYTLPRVSTYVGPTTGDPNYTPTKPTAVNYTYTLSNNGVTCNVAF